MIYVAIIDDDDEFRDNLQVVINSAGDLKCVGSYRDCESALRKLQEDLPEVVLLDISLGHGMSGIEGAVEIKKSLDDVEILMLTIREDEEAIFESLRNGASGYLAKNSTSDQIMQAVREVKAGGAPMSMSIARKVTEYFQIRHDLDTLTVREREILRYLSQGKSYKAIAEVTYVSVNTIKYHIKNIYRKLQVHSWPELAHRLMRDRGL